MRNAGVKLFAGRAFLLPFFFIYVSSIFQKMFSYLSKQTFKSLNAEIFIFNARFFAYVFAVHAFYFSRLHSALHENLRNKSIEHMVRIIHSYMVFSVFVRTVIRL